MSLTIIPLPDQTVECGYFQHKISTNEHFLVQNIDSDDLEMLLSRGFRHFGRYFFRPVCRNCSRCIPIRVDLRHYRTTPSAKKLLKKNRDLSAVISRPEVSQEAFDLYRQHKRRFSEGGTESFHQFEKAFFFPLTGAMQLSLYLDGKLVSVGHFDETENALSAVYTYYDDWDADRSFGTYTVNRLIRYAVEGGKHHLYLGYYIEENRHMCYKRRYYPNEISTGDGVWLPFITAEKEELNREAVRTGFSVNRRLF